MFAHPNKLPFFGLLNPLDVPSERVPKLEGHIFSPAISLPLCITTETARNSLYTIQGMALNCSVDFSTHNPTRKVGVITHAYVKKKALMIDGYLYALDFPELIDAFSKRELGLSLEIHNVRVRIVNDVLEPTDPLFVGASIIDRDKAAFKNTWIRLDREEIQ